MTVFKVILLVHKVKVTAQNVFQPAEEWEESTEPVTVLPLSGCGMT